MYAIPASFYLLFSSLIPKAGAGELYVRTRYCLSTLLLAGTAPCVIPGFLQFLVKQGLISAISQSA
jgi:hypothetical protein